MARKRNPLNIYSDEEIFSEAGRRRRALAPQAPNPKVLRPCPKCGKPFGARELRIHKPKCTGEAPPVRRKPSPSRT
jgi:hypothetical protein